MWIDRRNKAKCKSCHGTGYVIASVPCEKCFGYGSHTLGRLEEMRRKTNEGRNEREASQPQPNG